MKEQVEYQMGDHAAIFISSKLLRVRSIKKKQNVMTLLLINLIKILNTQNYSVQK